MLRSLFGAVALVSCAVPAHADVYEQFRDVGVSCSNALTCSIDLTGSGGALTSAGLTRRMGPDTPLGLYLYLDDLAPGARVELGVDGTPAATLAGSDFEPVGMTGRLVHSGDGTLDLLAAMRNGNALEIRIDGGTATRFSLSGLVASLVFVDETQGRLGARDALERKGEGQSPEAQLAEITRLADIPEAIRPAFEGAGDCSFYDEARFASSGGFSVVLSEAHTLYALPCAEGGAYNQPYVFYMRSQYGSGSDADFRAMALPAMTEEGPSTVDEAWNIGWDAETRIMTAFFKGRGIGDCGSWDRWGLRNTPAEPAFVLKESRFKEDCDGDNGGGPQNWPALWPIAR